MVVFLFRRVYIYIYYRFIVRFPIGLHCFPIGMYCVYCLA